MLLDELHQKRRAIMDAARAHGAHGIRVFGSVARGQEDQDSDIDFLVHELNHHIRDTVLAEAREL